MHERTRPARRQALAVEDGSSAPPRPPARRSLLDWLAPRRPTRGLPRWKRQASHPEAGHAVRFSAFGFPARAVASFLRDGLQQGDAAVVIATPSHERALRRRLAGLGPITFLDAQQTLDRLLVHDRPDAVRFDDVVGQAVRRAAAQANGRVRAFGEMVALLCERGEPEAAAQLEDLWNSLSRRQALSLLCCYPERAFSGRSRGHQAPLAALHSHAY